MARIEFRDLNALKFAVCLLPLKSRIGSLDFGGLFTENGFGRYKLQLGLAGLLVTAGILYRGAASTETPAAQAPPSSLAQAPAPDQGPLPAICRYYAIEPSKCPNDLPQFQALLAGVPNPEQTHLALYLDRALQSMVAAAQDESYSLATYWLPWDPAAQKLEPDAEKRARQIEARQRLEPLPGVLYFTPNPGKSGPPLAIFLIAETPTSGVDKFAFRKALSYLKPGEKASPLQHRGQTGAPGSIEFLGPFFSGSLPSLKDLIEPGYRYEVISGSVSDHATAQKVFAGTSVTFSSTLQDDHLAAGRFLHYLRANLSDSDGPVAILSETGTTYGDVLKGSKGGVLSLRYPREVSRIRNAYKERGLARSDANTNPVQQGLPLVLRDEEGGRDSIPSFSPQQSPVSQEAVLMSIADTLRREHVHYAGLIATDVLDLLFLSRFLRIACPDVRIFLFDADLLFIRGLDTAPFEGILSISTYPLFSRNQLWTQEQRTGMPPRRFLFPSADAQGVYNAARALIGPQTASLARECHENANHSEPFLEYAPPDGGREPPVWLNAIGRDGFWPVALLEPEKGEISSLYSSWCLDRHKSGVQEEPPSPLWQFVFVLLQCVSLLHLLLLALANDRRAEAWLKKKRLPYFWFEYYQVRYIAGLGSVRCFYLLLATLSVLALQSLLIAPLLQVPAVMTGESEWSPAAFLALPLIFSGLLAFAAVWLTVHSWDRSVFGVRRAVALGLFAVYAFVLNLVYRGRDSYSLFLAYRSLHPGNGLSPMVPLFFLFTVAGYLAFIHLRGMRFNAISAPQLPPLGPGLEAPVERIKACLRHSGSHASRVVPFLLLALWLVLFRPWQQIQTFENRAYDALIAALLTLLYWSLFSVWWQFVYGWRNMKRFLEFLERHPIRDAFTRLPKEFSWMPIWQTNGITLNYLALTRTRDALARIDSQYLPRFRLAAIRNGIERLQESQAANRPVDVAAYGALQHELRDEIADTLFNSAARWSKGVSDSYDRELSERKLLGKADLNELEILQDEFIALRCVAFIRYALMQLRNLLGFITTGFILSVLALSSYPFEAHHIISASVVLTFLLLGSGIVLVFVQMDRDAVLSRISETEANKLNGNFFLRLTSFGALPIITVLASQFPSISEFLFSWVRPTLEALK